MDAEAAPEPGDGPRRGSRSRAPSPVTGEGGSTPGQLALKAAYGYLEAAYESPAQDGHGDESSGDESDEDDL